MVPCIRESLAIELQPRGPKRDIVKFSLYKMLRVLLGKLILIFFQFSQRRLRSGLEGIYFRYLFYILRAKNGR